MEHAAPSQNGAEHLSQPIFPLSPDEVRALLRLGVIPPRRAPVARRDPD
ncbi:hypothetical protein [Actibacterium ureilyticum]|nr:hypothetical protein [Actibacterium ureilyticum]